MAKAARTFPVSMPDATISHDTGPPGDILEQELPLVVLVGRAADDPRLVRAARRADAITLIAPNIETAKAWFGRPRVPEADWGPAADVMAFDGLAVDLTSYEARWRGRLLDLTTQELGLLAALVEQPGTAWSFSALSERVWGSQHHGDRSMVCSAVQRLRRKLDSAAVGVKILSIRGMGFRLVHTPFN
jgi:two-component system response regulator MtrA